jgi:hypothetical protein
MTEEENEAENLAIVRWQEEHPDVWGDQDENGVDLARLRENLKLTPIERIRRNGMALVFLRQLEEARDRHRAVIKSSSDIP